MTTDLALTLLRRGANGDEILQILDTIASDDTMPTVEPTAEEIQF